jgi:Sortase domain
MLGGCAGAVDNREHPKPPSVTLPLRGAQQPRVGLVPETRTGSVDAPGVPPRAPGFEVGELPRQAAASGAAPPVRLDIPAIGVATRLVRLGVEPDGAMQVPGDFATAGWFAGGPVPGELGPAVIAGHVDSRTGPAVFSRLRELRPGDQIRVVRADRLVVRFTVESLASYPKAGFPTAAVFGPAPAAALRLITCAGDFDRSSGHYLDNLVVFAAWPAPPAEKPARMGDGGRNHG